MLEFEDTYNQWFNHYRVIDIVTVRSGRIADGADPTGYHPPYFLIEYAGAGGFASTAYGRNLNRYGGRMISDGRRFAYVVDGWVWDTIVEGAHPNLHCRTLIRQAIREYVDAMELWPE